MIFDFKFIILYKRIVINKPFKSSKLGKNFIDKLVSLFALLDFYTQKVDFNSVIRNDELKSLINNEYSSSPLAKLLIYFPDLFIMHSKLDATEGSFFIRVFDNNVNLTTDEIECYKKFYPNKFLIILLTKEANKLSLSVNYFKEFTQSGKLINFKKFFEDKLNFDLDEISQKALSTLNLII